MIKVFTLNENNKIELTKQELQKLLDEAYHEAYWTYVSSNKWNISPTKWTYDTTANPPLKTTTITVGDKQNEI